MVWLSDQKSLTDRRDPRLVANDGPIEVLICKEAIAIGWDCPRAQVLYKIRSHSRSETFDVQTVGRIMRTAEPFLGRPIGSTLLDRGYVYHHDTRYEATEDYGLRTAFAHLRDGLLSPQIETSVAVASPAHVQVEHMKEAVEIGFGGLGLLPGGTPRLDLAAIGEAETLAGAIIRDEAAVATGGTLVRTLRSRPEISEVFERLIASWAGGREEGVWMRDEIYWHTDQLGLTVAQVQTAFIEAANSATAGAEMRRGLEEVQVRAGLATTRSEVPFAWSLALIRDYNAAQDIEDGDGALHQVVLDPNGLYAFVPCYLRARRSQPERRFEEWLAAQSAIVDWWVKNGETPQRDLSLCYIVEGQGEPANFFPDFIVQFRDGVVGLYETKDDTAFSGQDATTNTAKLAALMRFADSRAGMEAAFALVGGSILFYTDPDGDPQSARSVERRHAAT